jgi:hypothetical protein
MGDLTDQMTGGRKRRETFAFIETEKFQLGDRERNEKRSRGFNLHERKTRHSNMTADALS